MAPFQPQIRTFDPFENRPARPAAGAESLRPLVRDPLRNPPGPPPLREPDGPRGLLDPAPVIAPTEAAEEEGPEQRINDLTRNPDFEARYRPGGIVEPYNQRHKTEKPPSSPDPVGFSTAC